MKRVNVSQIHQWAESEKVRRYLKEKFAIERIPCYYWLLSLLRMIKTESLNRCLNHWVTSLLPEDRTGLTIAVDGKTVRSTEKMKGYDQPLRIISAQLSELGLTFASKSVSGKSNEIPTVQKLLEELDISGCLVVADTLNCQKEMAKAVKKGKGDYLLCAKGNQPALLEDIRDYVQDDQLRGSMETQQREEKNRDRIEIRTAYVTTDVNWLVQREEWSVETMHWLLDVHFGEDYLRVANKTVQENINLLRKVALSLIKQFKTNAASKRPISKLMLDCLLDPAMISRFLYQN